MLPFGFNNMTRENVKKIGEALGVAEDIDFHKTLLVWVLFQEYIFG